MNVYRNNLSEVKFNCFWRDYGAENIYVAIFVGGEVSESCVIFSKLVGNLLGDVMKPEHHLV